MSTLFHSNCTRIAPKIGKATRIVVINQTIYVYVAYIFLENRIK